MQAYASQQLGEDIIYLSPMHITQRAISEYDVPDTHPRLVNLSSVSEWRSELKCEARSCIEKDDGCILAAHQFR